ncbi:MAG: alkaline phosphatase family protein [bacterium]|nr:alkaline phosphatase family protein [bacterium]
MRRSLALLLILAVLAPAGCRRGGRWTGDRKVIVLAFDGMDPRIVRGMFAEGKLPNLRALAERGDFRDLWSSVPPQSPVAWANFITGTNPGGHAIFDFIHRDPRTYLPFLSTSETVPPRRTLAVGEYILPLSRGAVVLRREGKAFWEYLAERGVPATVFRIPSNFPPVAGAGEAVSGMGTPDIVGSYGIYQYFTTDPSDIPKDPSGGEFTVVGLGGGVVRSRIGGPPDALRKGAPRMTVDFTARVDRESRAARIDVAGESVLLAQGEWSDWVTLRFRGAPFAGTVSGICRLYLKEASPHFRLYVSPINIDPRRPALPIDAPAGYARRIADEAGLFYTQGMPEDTKALTNGTFTTDEFYVQARMVHDESDRLFDHLYGKFDRGLFFYYYSSSDLGTHIFWHLRDAAHPAHDAAARARLGDVIEEIYERLDGVVGKVLDRLDDATTFIVMSDHGFGPYYKGFSLNTWLHRNGYLALKGGASTGSLFQNVDWSRTRAYALGLNSLYVNLRGREREGIVEPGSERDALAREIARRLEEVRDPENGLPVVRRAHLAEEVYSGDFAQRAPDLVVGYDWGYRTSWESALGDVTADLIKVSDEKWSGDHCGATEIVPGVLFANKRIRIEQPRLYDITPAILAEFGIERPAGMTGRSIFGEAPAAPASGPRATIGPLPYL